jgi:hypothetical protein
MQGRSGWVGGSVSSSVLCLTLALVGALSEPPARGQDFDHGWMTEGNWQYEKDDYVVLLVESPQQPPRHLLKSTTTVWASRAGGIVPWAPLEFQLVSRSVPTLQWSTWSYNKADPTPTRYPPPPDFYGPDAHLPPGIYFQSYARLQGDGRHRLGLSDRKCSHPKPCSNEVRAPGGERRSGLQFHAMFKDVEEFHKDLSQGCLTTHREYFEKIFPESFTNSATSPLSWNGTPGPREDPYDAEKGKKFEGSGNVLVFVTDPLAPGGGRQSESFRRWLREGRLSARVFVEGEALDKLRADWRQIAAAPELLAVSEEYEAALKKAAILASGGFRASRPEGLFIEGKVVKGIELLSRDHGIALDPPKGSLRAFEEKAWLSLAEALAGSDLDREAMTSRIRDLTSKVERPDPGWSTVVDVALALRRAGIREEVELQPALEAMLEYQRLVAGAAQKAERRLQVSMEVAPILEKVHQAVTTIERAREAPGSLDVSNADLETVMRLQKALVLIESTAVSGSPKVADLKSAAGLLPKELGEPVGRLVQAYEGFNQIADGSGTSDLEMIGRGVNVLAEALDLKEDETAKTVLTVVNVGLSLASGNYVGAAMALLGSGGSGGGGEGAAFQALGKQLQALLEGQRKILEDLQKIKKAIQALEEKIVRQHQEVLDGLADLDSAIRLNRRVALEGLYGDFQLCKSFYGRNETMSEPEAAQAWQILRRDFWARCDAALNRLAGWDTISQAFLFRTAATDTAGSKLEKQPELAPGDSRRAESDLFLTRVVEPVFIASRRRVPEPGALVLAASFHSVGTVEDRELRNASLGDAFASTETEILDRDFLLAPAEVVAFSRAAFFHARFWLSGAARNILDPAIGIGPERYEGLARSESRHLLHSVLRLLNQAIAQQVLLSSETLFKASPDDDLRALPVNSAELDALLTGSRMFPEGAWNVAGFLIDRLLTLDNKAGTYWRLRQDPAWALRLGDIGERYWTSGLRTLDGRPVELSFGQGLCPRTAADNGASPVVWLRFAVEGTRDPVMHCLVLAEEKQGRGVAPGRVLYPAPLPALQETRKEALKLLALAQLEPLSREALLPSN